MSFYTSKNSLPSNKMIERVMTRESEAYDETRKNKFKVETRLVMFKNSSEKKFQPISVLKWNQSSNNRILFFYSKLL